MNKRRLVGPTIISLVLCGLLTDHLLFREFPWSVTRMLGKIESGFVAIFAPAFDPALYNWVGEIALPASIIVVVLLLLLFAMGRAKSAMRRATAEPNAVATPPMRGSYSDEASGAALERTPSAARRGSWRFSLLAKLTVLFGTVGVLVGIATCIIVQGFVSRAIEREIRSRADVLALGIADTDARYMAAGTIQELGAQVAKYASSDTIAYVYIEDAAGTIVAHGPKDLPIYLKRDFPRSAELAIKGVDAEYRGLAVYEVAKQVGNGGFVHLGLWRGVIGAESRRTMASIAAAFLAALIVTLGVFIYVARSLSRPLLELVDHAERISKGDFAVPLGLKRADEIGEIARSLERMRSSLRAVVTRLEQGQFTNPS